MSLTRTFNITCDGVTKNSLTDFGLAVGNTNYIGEPTMEEYYVDVPGGPVIDLSDALTGRPVFKQRPITIEVGAMHDKDQWDSEMSAFRNLYDGRVCKITFDNDTDWYWTGRVRIVDFERTKSLGTFTIAMTADAYKYKVTPITDEYEPFMVPQRITMRSFAIPIEPVFRAVEGNLTLGTHRSDLGQSTYSLTVGVEFKVPGLLSNTDMNVFVDGSGTLEVIFREKSL